MLHCHGFLVKTLQCHEMSQPYVRKKKTKKGNFTIKIVKTVKARNSGFRFAFGSLFGFPHV